MILFTVCLCLIFISDVAAQGGPDLTALLQKLQKDVNTLKSKQEQDSKQLQVLKSETSQNIKFLNDLVEQTNISEHRQTNITNDLDLYKARLRNASLTQQQQKTELTDLEEKGKIIESIIGNVTALSVSVASDLHQQQTALVNVNQTVTQHEIEITRVKADDVKWASDVKRYESAMQSKFAKEERSVAFMAQIPANQTNNYQDIAGSKRLMLNSVLLNIGNSYNVTSGVFTAPAGGVYVFKLTATSASKNLRLRLTGDYRVFGSLAVDSQGDGGVTDAVVRFDAGDQLWVESTSEQPDAIASAQFSGVLLNTNR